MILKKKRSKIDNRMRAHYIQHVPFEGLGSIADWLADNGYRITSTRLFNNEPLPEVEAIDLLIIMGGPMSVNDEVDYPWLAGEKAFIRKAIDAEIPILGICLGAQLIASALGCNIFRNSKKEIGWFPIEAIPPKKAKQFYFPPIIQAFHWHGETFDLPENAIHLARSQGCTHQAFQVGTHIIALQFHLETTAESAQALVNHCGDELVTDKWIQSATEICAVPEARYQDANIIMKEVLQYLTQT